jgi:hypothetical protein
VSNLHMLSLLSVIFHLKILHVRPLGSSLHILVLTCHLGCRMCSDVCISVCKWCLERRYVIWKIKLPIYVLRISWKFFSIPEMGKKFNLSYCETTCYCNLRLGKKHLYLHAALSGGVNGKYEICDEQTACHLSIDVT